jgi:dihydrofolate reductase
MESPEKWVEPYQTEDVAEFVKAQNLEAEVLILGRLTYEAFITYWPFQTHNEFGFADHLNRQPKYVVSSTLEKVEWNNSHLLKGNVIEEIAKLKTQTAGKIGITGSGTLIESLMKANLIDEFRLTVYPLILGNGMRLFKHGTDTTRLKLIEALPCRSGVVALTYRVDQ